MKTALAITLLIISGSAFAGDFKSPSQPDPVIESVRAQLVQEGHGEYRVQRLFSNPNKVKKVQRVPVYVYDEVMVAPPCFIHYERRLPLILCGNPDTVTRTLRRQVGTQTITTYADGRQVITNNP